jgi:lactoylglutathione lyase
MENSLGQYCIYVSDMTRALEFWEGVVGLPVSSRTEIPGVQEVVLQADVGGSRIQLAQKLDDDSPIDMGNAMWKLYVDTDDCRAVYDKAIAAGCESVMEPNQLDRWPVTVAFVKDFDGYLIEFVQNHEGKRPSLRPPG